MKTYRAAVIGCGNIASLFDKNARKDMAFTHAGAYQMHPRFDLVAACDVDEARLKDFTAKWQVPAAYQDYTQMLAKEAVDVVSICTPPQTHAAIVSGALAYPLKAIYCEKPIALNTADAKAMIKACRDKGVLLLVNHQRRFAPFWQEIKAKLDEGFLGRVQQVTCYYTRGIYNTGVHILDLFNFLFGPPQWVTGLNSVNQSPIPNDPNIEAMIGYGKGLVINLKPCDDANYLILEIDILGSKGRLRIGSDVQYFKTGASQNMLGKNELSTLQPSPIQAPYGPVSLTLGLEHLVACLEEGAPVLSSGEDALQTIATIEALIKAVDTKQIVPIGGKL